MGRRKEFKSIVEDVTQFFISRNNDIEGYWGIGKLYFYIGCFRNNETKNRPC